MMFYRGKDENNWESELQSIIEMAKHGYSKQINVSHLHFLMSPDFLKPFRCVGILNMMFSVSGMFTISTYTDTFMEVWTEKQEGNGPIELRAMGQ